MQICQKQLLQQSWSWCSDWDYLYLEARVLHLLYCTVPYCTVLYCIVSTSSPFADELRLFQDAVTRRLVQGWHQDGLSTGKMVPTEGGGRVSDKRLAVNLGRFGLFTTNCSLEYKYIKYILNWLQKSQLTQPSVISQHISILLWVLLNEGIPFRKNYLSIFFSPLKRSGSPNLITKRVSPLMGRILSWGE